MRKALATLPWVEYSTIDADKDTHKVRFGINDRKPYSEEALTEALPKRFRKGVKVLQGP